MRIVGMIGLDLPPHQVLFAEQSAQVFSHQLVLGREVPVQRHLVGFGGFGDGVDADGPNPMPIKQLGRGRQDACARRDFLSNVSGLDHDPNILDCSA